MPLLEAYADGTCPAVGLPKGITPGTMHAVRAKACQPPPCCWSGAKRTLGCLSSLSQHIPTAGQQAGITSGAK